MSVDLPLLDRCVRLAEILAPHVPAAELPGAIEGILRIATTVQYIQVDRAITLEEKERFAREMREFIGASRGAIIDPPAPGVPPGRAAEGSRDRVDDDAGTIAPVEREAPDSADAPQPGTKPPAEAMPAATALTERILAHLADHPRGCGLPDIADAVGASVPECAGALSVLEADGRVSSRGGAGPGREYSLPGVAPPAAAGLSIKERILADIGAHPWTGRKEIRERLPNVSGKTVSAYLTMLSDSKRVIRIVDAELGAYRYALPGTPRDEAPETPEPTEPSEPEPPASADAPPPGPRADTAGGVVPRLPPSAAERQRLIDEAIAAGRLTKCPTVAVEATQARIPEADRAAIRERNEARDAEGYGFLGAKQAEAARKGGAAAARAAALRKQSKETT